MFFKYYLVTNNFDESVDFYEELFDAKIEKNNKYHAKMWFFGKMQFLLYSEKTTKPKKEGYLIIKFDKSEKDLYDKVKDKVKKRGLKINIDDKAYKWGTTITEFVDPYGYTWDIEIDTDQ